MTRPCDRNIHVRTIVNVSIFTFDSDLRAQLESRIEGEVVRLILLRAPDLCRNRL